MRAVSDLTLFFSRAVLKSMSLARLPIYFRAGTQVSAWAVLLWLGAGTPARAHTSDVHAHLRVPSGQSSPRPVTTPTPAPRPLGVSAEDLEALEKLLGSPEPNARPMLPPAPSPPPMVGAARTFQNLNPDISIIMDVAAAAFSSEPDQRGGHDPRANGFNLQQLEMAIGAPVDPFWRFDSNLVYSQFGVEIEEAYATSLMAPFNLQARAGQFLTRFGRVNATHPHSWEFVDQPLANGKFFGGEGNRGLGGEVSWLAPLPWYLEVVGSATEAKGGATARSFLGNDNLSVRSPFDTQMTGSIKQFFPLSPDWSLNWGLNGATGPNASGRDNRTDILGTDLYVKWRPLSANNFFVVNWTTEAMTRRRQLPARLLIDYGGYSSLFWRFAQQWGTAVRYELISGLPGDPLDPDWTGDRGRLSANVTFWPTEFSRFRLQASVDNASWRQAPVYATFFTVETVTGAHGAHKF